MHGEHRVPSGKLLPYEPSIRVPLMMRGPGVPRGVVARPARRQRRPRADDPRRDRRDAPRGRRTASCRFLRDPSAAARDILIEGPARKRGGGLWFTGLRTRRYLYVERDKGERELYDLARDPEELRNLAGTRPAWRRGWPPRLARLRVVRGRGVPLAPQLAPHGLARGREVGREAVEQDEPVGLDLGGTAHRPRRPRRPRPCGRRQPGPEQQLVRAGRELGRAAVERAGLLAPARRPSARRRRPPARRRAGGRAAGPARASGSVWSSTRRSTRAATARPRRARRAARPTGGRGRRRPRPARRAERRRGAPRGRRRPPRTRRHRGGDRLALHHVRLAAVALAAGVAGEVDAVGPVGRRRRPDVDDPDLADGAQRIGGEQRLERLLRGSRRRWRRSSAFGPCAGSTTDCVATAPTAGRAQVHSEPTENQCDCTAAPSSPVWGSWATIE